MTGPEDAAAPPPRRAALQAAGFLAFMYALIYGGSALLGDDRFASPVLHVFLTGGLTLLVVAALVARDGAWRDGLGLLPAPLWRTVGSGLLGVAFVYAVNVAVSVPYLVATGGLQARVAEKAGWAFELAKIPLGWVLPLTLFVGFYEEVAFRGFLLRRLEASLRPRGLSERARWVLAAALSGVAFGGLHGYQGTLGLLQTSAVGVALGLLAAWRRSTWPGVVAHFTIDAAGLLMLRVLAPWAQAVLERLKT